MIERITVHLEKKKEDYKEKGFEKSNINIVDQGNAKFMSLTKVLFLHQAVLINVL